MTRSHVIVLFKLFPSARALSSFILEQHSATDNVSKRHFYATFSIDVCRTMRNGISTSLSCTCSETDNKVDFDSDFDRVSRSLRLSCFWLYPEDVGEMSQIHDSHYCMWCCLVSSFCRPNPLVLTHDSEQIITADEKISCRSPQTPGIKM